MKLLIVGGTGFIGKNLKNYFSNNVEYDVFAPTRQELNLSDDSACKDYLSKIKPDYVIHSAVDIRSVENSLKAFFNIFNNHNSFGHLIQIGSGAEYDKRNYCPLMNESLFSKLIPIDTYGLSKYTIANTLENSNLKKFTNLRLFGNYGKYEDYSRRFISNNICRVLAGYPIKMNRNMLFDYIYVDDFAKFLEALLPRLPLSEVSYNFCSGKPISFVDLASKVKNIMDVKEEIIIKNDGMAPEYSGDPSKVLKEFPDFKFSSFDENIMKLVDFYKSTLSSADLDSFRESLDE